MPRLDGMMYFHGLLDGHCHNVWLLDRDYGRKFSRPNTKGNVAVVLLKLIEYSSIQPLSVLRLIIAASIAVFNSDFEIFE